MRGACRKTVRDHPVFKQNYGEGKIDSGGVGPRFSFPGRKIE